MLADTSAWYVAQRSPRTLEAFRALLVEGQIATCDMVKLELLRGARNPGDFARRRDELDALPQCVIGPAEWKRALDVYGEVCRRGPGNDAHRRINHQDLLIAAAAEASDETVLHYDTDYDAIAEVTGQPSRWIVPRGTQ